MKYCLCACGRDDDYDGEFLISVYHTNIWFIAVAATTRTNDCLTVTTVPQKLFSHQIHSRLANWTNV